MAESRSGCGLFNSSTRTVESGSISAVIAAETVRLQNEVETKQICVGGRISVFTETCSQQSNEEEMRKDEEEGRASRDIATENQYVPGLKGKLGLSQSHLDLPSCKLIPEDFNSQIISQQMC